MCVLTGVGYHMSMIKTDTCSVRDVTALVTQFVPDAKVESDAGAELSFILPHESSARCMLVCGGGRVIGETRRYMYEYMLGMYFDPSFRCSSAKCLCVYF